MKKILTSILILATQGCANFAGKELATEQLACIGSTDLPSHLADRFVAIDDNALLAEAIGEPLQGKLCQGQVYQSTAEVTLYRAFNSTNPHSRLGQWWAYDRPSGLTAQYRKDFEICYQWSPLDKLVQCQLQAGSKVVIGNGQSAQCSQYLTYPVSKKQQVFLADAANAVVNCEESDSVLYWQ